VEDLSRRSLLLGGGAVAGGAIVMAGCSAAPERAASTTAGANASTAKGMYIWALNPKNLIVPNATWTKLPWPTTALNSTDAHVDTDGATWIFPVPTASGIWSMLCNVAWDNAHGPHGAAINPPTHRKLVRILQQSAGTPQNAQLAYVGAASDLTYHADLAARGDQARLADGSLGYQQQQVFVQAGFANKGPDQRTWVEVYQDSGQPLVCRADGSNVPATDTRPPLTGWLAPSLMFAKMCDF
jgi:hypothetical protein